jgi:hypothetical protein
MNNKDTLDNFRNNPNEKTLTNFLDAINNSGKQKMCYCCLEVANVPVQWDGKKWEGVCPECGAMVVIIPGRRKEDGKNKSL